MSFTPHRLNISRSGASNCGSVDSSDSDLVVVAIHEANNSPVVSKYHPPDEVEPMDIAIPPTAIPQHVEMSAQCETGSVAAMSVDLNERSNSAGGSSEGITPRSNQMEHGESDPGGSKYSHNDFGSTGSVFDNRNPLVRAKSVQGIVIKPTRVTVVSPESSAPTVPLKSNSQSTQHISQSHATHYPDQWGIPSQTTPIRVNLIPAQTPSQSNRFSTPSLNNATVSVSSAQAVNQVQLRPRATVKSLLQQKRVESGQSQPHHLTTAQLQHQLGITKNTPKLSQVGNVVQTSNQGNPKLLVSSSGLQSRIVANISRVSNPLTQKSVQIGSLIKTSTSNSSTSQPTLIANSLPLAPQNSSSLAPDITQGLHTDNSLNVKASSAVLSKGTVESGSLSSSDASPASFQKDSDPELLVDSGKMSPNSVVQSINEAAFKLQLYPRLLSNSLTSTVASRGRNTFENTIHCLVCSTGFNNQIELKRHLDRKSLILKYISENSSEPLVFFNKCSLLYHFRRLNTNIDTNKLSVAYYVPSLLTELADHPTSTAPVVKITKSLTKSQTPVKEKSVKVSALTCPECGKMISTSLEEHFQRYQGDLLICKKCEVPSTNHCQASAHAKLHRMASVNYMDVKPTCPNCGQTSFGDMASFLVHLFASCMAQMRFMGFRCLFCQFVSRDLFSLFKHVNNSHVQNAPHEDNSDSVINIDCSGCGHKFRGSESSHVTALIINHCLGATDCSHRPMAIREICKHCSRIFHPGPTTKMHIERGHASQIGRISKTSVPFYCALCRKNLPKSAIAHVTEAHSTVPANSLDPLDFLETFNVVNRDYLIKSAPHSQPKLCFVCEGLFDGERILEHLSSHHDRICCYCLDVFESEKELSTHLNSGKCLVAGKVVPKKRKKFSKRGRPSKKDIEIRQASTVAARFQFGFRCFRCEGDAAIFPDIDALSLHIRSMHAVADASQETLHQMQAVTALTDLKLEQIELAPTSQPAPKRKHNRQLEHLIPYICYACEYVAMSQGSLEAHQRRCNRMGELPLMEEDLSPGLHRAAASRFKSLSNDSIRQIPVSSSESMKPSCSLCPASFEKKTDFIAHMARHISLP